MWVGRSEVILGVHGRKDKAEVNVKQATDRERIYLVGLDTDFIKCIEVSLSAAGFESLVNGHRFSAKNPENICNRGIRKRGAGSN